MPSPTHAGSSPMSRQSSGDSGRDKKGPWSHDEDVAMEAARGRQAAPERPKWSEVAAEVAGRSAKQCRERYEQNLAARLSKAPISEAEGAAICAAVDALGKKWAEISRQLGNRSDNAIKNWYNGMVQKGKTGRHSLTSPFVLAHFAPRYQHALLLRFAARRGHKLVYRAQHQPAAPYPHHLAPHAAQPPWRPAQLDYAGYGPAAAQHQHLAAPPYGHPQAQYSGPYQPPPGYPAPWAPPPTQLQLPPMHQQAYQLATQAPAPSHPPEQAPSTRALRLPAPPPINTAAAASGQAVDSRRDSPSGCPSLASAATTPRYPSFSPPHAHAAVEAVLPLHRHSMSLPRPALEAAAAERGSAAAGKAKMSLSGVLN